VEGRRGERGVGETEDGDRGDLTLDETRLCLKKNAWNLHMMCEERERRSHEKSCDAFVSSRRNPFS
jgi:hypothetical protein